MGTRKSLKNPFYIQHTLESSHKKGSLSQIINTTLWGVCVCVCFRVQNFKGSGSSRKLVGITLSLASVFLLTFSNNQNETINHIGSKGLFIKSKGVGYADPNSNEFWSLL